MGNTHYDEDTINEWYKGFKQDCPDGHLDSLSFMKIYSKCFPTGNASEFCDHVFRTFDVDDNGWIDLPEMTKIVRSIYRMTGPKGGESYETPEVRAASIFKRMDVNSDGKVTRQEFVTTCLDDQQLIGLLTPNVR